MIVAALLALAAAAPPEPSYLVERVVTVAGVVRRTSVFRNGVAAFVTERSGEAKRVLRQPLTDVEFAVLAQVTAEGYDGLARLDSVGEGPGGGTIELRLAPVGKPVMIVRYAASAVPPLAAARIGQALDGLEANLAKLPAPREDLRDWVPRVGDRVELDDGRVIVVLEVLPSGDKQLVRAQIGDGPAYLYIGDEELRRKALRRIGK